MAEPITREQIKYMVDRFLGWKLPANFAPDAGISFKAEFNEHNDHPTRHEPSGTNLFDATQAEAMVRYMIEGLPDHPDRIKALQSEIARKDAALRSMIALDECEAHFEEAYERVLPIAQAALSPAPESREDDPQEAAQRHRENELREMLDEEPIP